MPVALHSSAFTSVRWSVCLAACLPALGSPALDWPQWCGPHRDGIVAERCQDDLVCLDVRRK